MIMNFTFWISEVITNFPCQIISFLFLLLHFVGNVIAPAVNSRYENPHGRAFTKDWPYVKGNPLVAAVWPEIPAARTITTRIPVITCSSFSSRSSGITLTSLHGDLFIKRVTFRILSPYTGSSLVSWDPE